MLNKCHLEDKHTNQPTSFAVEIIIFAYDDSTLADSGGRKRLQVHLFTHARTQTVEILRKKKRIVQWPHPVQNRIQ